MTLQSRFNKECINYLPRIKTIIEESNFFEANQMKNKAIEWAMTSIKPFSSMCAQELESFENALISVFKDKSWII